MEAEDTANRVFVDFNAESQCGLLSDARATPTGIPPFHFHHSRNEFFARAFGAGTAAAPGRKQQAILPPGQHLMETQQCGRLQHDGRADQARRANETPTKTRDQAIRSTQVRRSLAATI
jgi:hypothetical protein